MSARPHRIRKLALDVAIVVGVTLLVAVVAVPVLITARVVGWGGR